MKIMKIVNATKNTVLADSTLIANTPTKRIIGLLGRKEFKPGEALFIKPCNSIHTFFMRFAIDVLFVDKHNRVIKAISFLKPFRITPIYFKAEFTIELPAARIHSTQTQEGDTISFIK